MTDAVHAVAELFRAIPVRVRQSLYGVVGLVVLIDAWFDLFSDDISGKLTSSFAGLTLIMALANATKAPLPPPPLPPLVDERYPGEFA
jgi:hypothetical protein